MKKQIFAFALALGCFLSGCTSENAFGIENSDEKISSENIVGYSQKGPILAGASVFIQELDSVNFLQTGKSFRGKVISDNGEFVVENVNLNSPYVLLEVNGYFRNEITGKNSNGAIFMNAIADVSEQSHVNINLLTHLEYERVQVLLEQKKMSIAEAKRVADREILASFFDETDYGKVEQLDIFGNGKGDAALLAINVLLLGEGKEADFMEHFAKLGNDLAQDGVWNDSALRTQIADRACEMDLDGNLPVIRKNIENWKIAERVAPFEPYVTSFWKKSYGLGECRESNMGETKKNSNTSSIYYGLNFTCDKSERWVANLDVVRAGCDSCGFMIDPRDGHKYRTIKIAGANWMAENLAYNGYGEGSFYHDDESYGLWYEVGVAMLGNQVVPDSSGSKWTYYIMSEITPVVYYLHTGCPEGWRLPTREDYYQLMNATASNNYELLLSPKGWNLKLGYDFDPVAYFTSTFDPETPYGQRPTYYYARMYASGSEIAPEIVMGRGMAGGGFIRCVEEGLTQEKSVLPASEVVADSFVDERDGKTYKTIKFGNQEWMAQNVEYPVGDSTVGDGERRCEAIWEATPSMFYPDPCDIGWRYDWYEVQEACPEGWKIPSVDDAKKMLEYVGGASGNAALFTLGLEGSQDIYGFSALPTQYEQVTCAKMINGCTYKPVGAKFWISDSTGRVRNVLAFDKLDVGIKPAVSTDYLPVRCVKDAE
jgi:uncharacterized protein (TIGR02145 family)